MAERTRTGVPVLMPAAPTTPAVYAPQALPVRPVPSTGGLATGGMRDRRLARRTTRNADVATGTLAAVERYYDQVQATERARQAAEAAHLERQALIAQAETQVAQHLTERTNALTALDSAGFSRELTRLQFEEQQREDLRQRQLEPLKFRQLAAPIIKELATVEAEIAGVFRKEEFNEADALAKLNDLRRTQEKNQAEHARSQQLAAEAHRSALLQYGFQQLDYVLKNKTLLDAVRKVDEPPDTTPPELRRHLDTEQRVQAAHSEAAARISRIYEQALMEGRSLTEAEKDIIHSYLSASRGSEDEIRRGAAGFDFAAE
jgi:hypothetical protein